MRLKVFGFITCKVCGKLFVTDKELKRLFENHRLLNNFTFITIRLKAEAQD